MSAVPNPASNVSTNAALSDEQRMLADAVTTFVGRATNLKRVRALRDTEPGFDRNLWASIAEQGWLGIVVPEQYGGQGLGFGEMRVVVEGLGGALIPEPVIACAVLASRRRWWRASSSLRWPGRRATPARIRPQNSLHQKMRRAMC